MFDIEKSLKKVASNLWFEWNPEVHSLFELLSPQVWKLYRRNPHRFLGLQDENFLLFRYRLVELMQDPKFIQLFESVWQNFQNYLNSDQTLINTKYPELKNKTVAYFSMEYGFDTLPIYSGGLGVLSGDHLRGASDLGVSLVAVGLFYIQGYYKQQIDEHGDMKVHYESVVPPNKQIKHCLPLKALKKAGTDEDLILDIPIHQRSVKARVWKVKVGRVDLLLLDSDVQGNNVHDRHISRRLYASKKHRDDERQRRLEQEMLLGIGGAMALKAGGYEVRVYHLNEGHVAFAAIEIIRQQMEQGLHFEEAKNRAALKIGFTTHTPVPEGNERFDERLVRDHMQNYLNAFLKQDEKEFIFNCARNRHDEFDMTKLSLLLSGIHRNGVSQLHGEVCRKMWGYAWGIRDEGGRGVPIDAITNAVHIPYWQKSALQRLIKDYGGIDHVQKIPDEKIWDLHQQFKDDLIAKARERYAYQMIRQNVIAQKIYESSHKLLSHDGFFIGFARRFAQYKRVTFIFDEEEVLFSMMERVYKKYGHPIHILYAGKPHPDNQQGRHHIRFIHEISQRLEARCLQRNFRGQIIFIQGYDINLARFLESGVDIWLNNPIRPLEASGTSGMKAGINGVLNLSISDGWVPEGIVHDQNGWIFGSGDAGSGERDRLELFSLLEETILPRFFDRPQLKSNFSPAWVKMMKNSIESLAKKFNTDRMLEDYIQRMYLPSVRAQSKEFTQVK